MKNRKYQWFLLDMVSVTPQNIYGYVPFQPLFNLSPGQYRGFVRYFQSFATNNTMNKHDLRGVLYKHGINATNSELQQMIDAISVDRKCHYLMDRWSLNVS